MKISIFTGGTSIRSKNIFTDISRYPTGKHEIMSISPLKKGIYIVVSCKFVSEFLSFTHFRFKINGKKHC